MAEAEYTHFKIKAGPKSGQTVKVQRVYNGQFAAVIQKHAEAGHPNPFCAAAGERPELYNDEMKRLGTRHHS